MPKVLFIDFERCIGCRACQAACIECGGHESTYRNYVSPVDPGVSTQTVPMTCFHCKDPYVYWILIIPVLLTALAIWFLGKDAPRPAAASAQDGESIWTSPQAWLLSLFYFVSFGGFVAFSNYLPKLYQELHAMSAAQAGSYTAIFVLVATLARPLGGWLSDRITADRVLSPWPSPCWPWPSASATAPSSSWCRTSSRAGPAP